MNINDRILMILETLKITQKEFAEKTGINEGTLTSIKKKKYEPSAQTIVKICETYNINANWLLFGKGSMFLEGREDELTLKELLPYLNKLTKLGSNEKKEIFNLIGKYNQK